MAAARKTAKAAVVPTVPAIPTGALRDNMAHRVVHTAVAGFDEFRRNIQDITEVKISLEYALHEDWTGATWDVELLLPPGVDMKPNPDVEGERLPSKLEELSRTDVAVFEVELLELRDETDGSTNSLMHNAERHELRGALAVKVFNGESDTSLHVPHGNDGRGRWHYPVTFIVERG